MIKSRVIAALDRTGTVHLAMLASLLAGLFFTFVWAPHPWGWQGIDQYHALASALARGEPFGTTDVPWGYAYFATIFYRLFGPHVLLPVVAQVFLNATAPWLLYQLVKPWATTRVAVLAALLTGVLSFNNVYASTQASDALCTVLFLAALLTLSRAIRSGRASLFVLAGFLAGVVPQFRPNMILFPGVVAVLYVVSTRGLAQLRNAILYCVFTVVALMPWIARNYQLTSEFLPTSTHGGMQLWYGTLQVGPYLESRARNPRSVFETPSFHYTSLPDVSIHIDGFVQTCHEWQDAAITLRYWTDRDAQRHTAQARAKTDERISFEVPGQPLETTLYYYFVAEWTEGGTTRTMSTPTAGDQSPFVFFISANHLGDLDRHGDVDDIFDFLRIAAAPGATADQLQPMARRLLGGIPLPPAPVASVAHGRHIVITFEDRSTLTMPPSVPASITDVEVSGGLASAIIGAKLSTRARNDETPFAEGECRLTLQPRVNNVFYRAEPHMMRRYMALAMDNINRDRLGFAAASAYRMFRLFIIRGTDDVHTAQQFSAARLAYTAGTVLSTVYLVVFFAGVWIAWRQRSTLLWLLVPIVYVPVTICFVLTNMRYTVTMQPLMFVFVAMAVVAAFRLDSTSERSAAAGGSPG